MATKKRTTKRAAETGVAERSELALVTKKGKRRLLVAAPPALAGARPGDLLYGALDGGSPKSFLHVENSFFWNGSAWDNSGTIVPLSAKEASDPKLLAKARRKYLKMYGYL